MVHGAFEYPNKMQTIEIYTPNRDASGKFLGLNHEAVFYDAEALVEPVGSSAITSKSATSTRATVRIHRLRTDDLPDRRQSQPVTPGTEIQYGSA